MIAAVPPQRKAVERCLANAAGGAAGAGREFVEDSFQLTTLTAMAVLEPGEDLTSDRVIEQCGPMAVLPSTELPAAFIMFSMK